MVIYDPVGFRKALEELRAIGRSMSYEKLSTEIYRETGGRFTLRYTTMWRMFTGKSDQKTLPEEIDRNDWVIGFTQLLLMVVLKDRFQDRLPFGDEEKREANEAARVAMNIIQAALGPRFATDGMETIKRTVRAQSSFNDILTVLKHLAEYNLQAKLGVEPGRGE